MKPIIAWVGGRVPSRCPAAHVNMRERGRKISGCLAENFIRLAQLTVFPFQRLDAITLFGCHSVAHAAVLLSLLDPSAQGLGNTADLGCNGRDRARLRFVGALMLEHHSDRASADLWRVAICHFAFCHNHHPYLS